LKPVRLLMTILGIGFLTALTLYAEICDIRRFSNPDKLARYCGLVRRVSQSGDHTRVGKETKGNQWLKCILIEAARGGVQKAVVAVARKMLVSIYYVLKRKEPYRGEDSRLRRRKLIRLRRRAS